MSKLALAAALLNLQAAGAAMATMAPEVDRALQKREPTLELKSARADRSGGYYLRSGNNRKLEAFDDKKRRAKLAKASRHANRRSK